MTRPARAVPSPAHLAWADCEVGVIIHLDVQVFEPAYQFRERWGYTPPPSVFHPQQLNTDQWLDAAASAGAKYAVLVAKHCSGFSLWPTKAHDYSVAASPWRNGTGDIVGDFVVSCRRRGIQPGLYCSASCNARLNVDNPGTVRSGDASAQRHYNEVVVRQLTELWTNYGELFEIWFDGGVLPPERGGPEIVPLLDSLQPNAVVFQGPPGSRSLLRWVGNERGEAPEDCWSTTGILTQEDGTTERLDLAGTPDGLVWAPAESDMPNRDQHRAFQGGWFWRKGDDDYLYTVDHLVERYYQSVGRNTNLLLGMVIDNRGLVPETDVVQFAAFGREVKRRFAKPVATTQGKGAMIDLPLPQPARITQAVVMEDTRDGHRIRAWEIQGQSGNAWRRLASGRCIGHKRIVRFDPAEVTAVRLVMSNSAEEAVVHAFSVYG